VAALTALGGIVRFATLDAKSFWQDEATTAILMRADLWDLVATRVKESEATPPLFYALEWGVAQAFGTGEVSLRLLPALFGAAAIPFAYLAGKELLSERAGVAAAALVAVNPLLVWYSQEARAYSLLVLLSAVALWCFARAVNDPTPRRLAAWAAASGLALLTHYFAAFAFAAQAVILLARGARTRAAWAAVGAAGAVGVALIPLAAAQVGHQRAGWIVKAPLLDRAVQLPALLLVGFESPAPIAVAAVAGLLALGILLVLARRAGPKERRGAAIAAAVAVAAAGIPLTLALGGLDYFIYKNVIAAAVAGSVLLGAGIGASRLGMGLGAALCALSLGVVVATAWEPKYRREDWRQVAEVIGEPRGPVVIVSTPSEPSRETLDVYLGAERDEAPVLRAREVVVVGAAQRPLGATEKPRTPRPSRAPRPPSGGFRLVQRYDDDLFVLFRYRAPRPVSLPASALAAMRVDDAPPMLLRIRR
jgi:hypothetical protein